MTLSVEVLFDQPQQEIASRIADRLSRSTATSIVTGFATPGGLASIASPLKSRPLSLATLVVGAATYPGFGTLDELVSAGVPSDRLFVHLGHSAPSGGRKNPFVRHHPMLHSKVYYMELPDSRACAFIGSHNLTSFALNGLNGEAGVYLEADRNEVELEQVRRHIATARAQSVGYTTGMRHAFAWWTEQFLDGLSAEMRLPRDGTTVRTILVFAEAPAGTRLSPGDHLYFEIPAGIEQIERLQTETHLFLFSSLPSSPRAAIQALNSAFGHYKCQTLGAENKQGNLELTADWRIYGAAPPLLQSVPTRQLRPNTAAGLQQVRAEVETAWLPPYEYLFETDRQGWDPEFSEDDALRMAQTDIHALAHDEALPVAAQGAGWRLVRGLRERSGKFVEPDAAALELASPESGSFILVSLRRRKVEHYPEQL